MRNKHIRRLVLETLYHQGCMTKGQMFDHLKQHYRLLKEPTEHSLSSIMQKNCQIVKVGKTDVHTQSGGTTKHILFDINREMITNYEELLITMPIGITTERERKDFGVIRCSECARQRLRVPDFKRCKTCWECHTSTS